jgi:hypothetical protein
MSAAKRQAELVMAIHWDLMQPSVFAAQSLPPHKETT